VSLSIPDSSSSQLEGRKTTLSFDDALLLLFEVLLEVEALDSLPVLLKLWLLISFPGPSAVARDCSLGLEAFIILTTDELV
jgi:hypothetical protein